MAIPLSAERLIFGLSSAGEPVISPDGEHVLYLQAQAHRRSNQMATQLRVCDIDGGGDRLVTPNEEGAKGACWSPDGRRIAFVAGQTARQGVFIISSDGNDDPRCIARGHSLSDLAWSPDSARLAYTALIDPASHDDPTLRGDALPIVRVTRRRDYKHDGRGYLNDARLQVFTVDVETGDAQQLSRDLVDHFAPAWSPDGRQIATQVHVRNGLYSRLAIIDVAADETTWVGDDSGVVGLWSWSPTGDQILFAGDCAQTWQLDFFLHDMRAGTTRRLTDDLDILPQAGFPTLWVPPAQPVWLDERTALFHAVKNAASGLFEIDVHSGEVTPKQQWNALHTGLSVDAAGRYVVQSRSSLVAVGEISVFERSTGTTQLIARQNEEALREAPPARWERFDVERAGETIEAWLLRPLDFDSTRRYPLILDVHGGPQGFFGYGFRPVQQLLATNGFLVVYANPRGSTSYGRDFAQGVVGDWGGGDFDDLMAVVDHALTKPYVDAGRLGIHGYSYGGFMTAWTISQTQRFKAAVCGAPVFDLESFYGTSDVGYVYGPLEWGGAPADNRDWCLVHSPSTFAHETRTPTLIMHGEADDRCPIGQGEQMFVALNEAGCDVEFARYPGGAHDMPNNGSPALREDMLERILAWFTSHLGGPN